MVCTFRVQWIWLDFTKCSSFAKYCKWGYNINKSNIHRFNNDRTSLKTSIWFELNSSVLPSTSSFGYLITIAVKYCINCWGHLIYFEWESDIEYIFNLLIQKLRTWLIYEWWRHQQNLWLCVNINPLFIVVTNNE